MKFLFSRLKLKKTGTSFFYYIIFIFLYTGCVHNQAEVLKPSNMYEDENYQPVLTKWSKSTNIYKDLELKFKITAVLISPEMEEAYKNRIEYIYGPKAKIDEKILLKKDTIAVVLDFFSKPDTFFELSDEGLWKISLKINDIIVPSHEIHPYRRKEGLKPFFPLSSYWSKHYIVLFKLPSEALKGLEVKDLFLNEKKESKELSSNEENKITLSMHSAEAQIKFSWNN
ncbi:hypothetical protein QEJ31_14055 [Pigmentibacter sp. JX0631]|uniref:hypothetical protein n=1 Tax=Pigmentibacter sp. JX0631 TaxID=2976982 RepID=UPI002468BC13|nr:hypothetical protein [Pigmentibacter sp. JX0631]WGL59651.1 hypothetical protein QEJ31_14055 [Pigmentibacter sp. JX0631]